MRPAIHPGEVLAEELHEISVTPTELARQLRVPANRINRLYRGSARSLPKPPCGWDGTLEPHPSSG